MLVAGDISPDGRRILLRRAHNEGAWMWIRDDLATSVEDVLTGSAPCDLDLVEEEQGEAIAVSPDVSRLCITPCCVIPIISQQIVLIQTRESFALILL